MLGPPTYKNSFQNWRSGVANLSLIPGFLTLSWHFSEVDQKECTRHPFCFVWQLTGFKNSWEGSVWAHAALWVPRVARGERTVLLWKMFLFATTLEVLGYDPKKRVLSCWLGLLGSRWKPKISHCVLGEGLIQVVPLTISHFNWREEGMWTCVTPPLISSNNLWQQLACILLWGTFATSFSSRTSTWEGGPEEIQDHWDQMWWLNLFLLLHSPPWCMGVLPFTMRFSYF